MMENEKKSMYKKYRKEAASEEEHDKMVGMVTKMSNALRGRTISIVDMSVQFLTLSNLGGPGGKFNLSDDD